MIVVYAQALPKDTLYHVRFVSGEDTMPLCFAQVKAFNSGVLVASWETGLDGYITIKRKEIRQYPKALITLDYPGYGKVTFKADTLFTNDTVIILAKPQTVGFNEIQIISYKVPMIDRDDEPWYRRLKREKKKPEKFPVYSPQQCIAYEALQKGVWLNKDTLTRKLILAYDTVNKHYKPVKGYGPATTLQHYFKCNITYPKQALEFLMEEKVYLSFELDEKGSVQYIKVLKGNSVDLVLEAANALTKLPRLNLRNEYSDYYEPYPPKNLKVRFTLPVKFILK